MAIPKDIETAFFAQQKGDVVTFCYNDAVEVTTGDHAGKKGNIVLLVDMEPQIIYMLTLEDGTDIELSQTALKMA